MSVTISLQSRREEIEHFGPSPGMGRPDRDWIIDSDQAILPAFALGNVGVLFRVVG